MCQKFVKTSRKTTKPYLCREHNHPRNMNSYKRSYDDFSGYEAFQFPRNVRARLCAGNQVLILAPHRPAVKFQPILRRLATVSPDCSRQGDVHMPNRRRISFYQKVAVHSIPARHQYTRETRERIWNNLLEIQEMARRNTIEFASEGYNWRKAAEDDAMLLTPEGERVHPVWRQVLDFQPTRNQIRIRKSADTCALR
jgi:hypothetical protein